MKRIVMLLLLLIIYKGVAQTPSLNAWKYWYYRWRLVNDFLLVGDCHGCSIPATKRHDGSSVGQYSPILKWGDAAIDLGWYIAVLASEYRVLKDNGEAVDSVGKELYYALKALERLDKFSDAIEAGDTILIAGSTDGYFVRDDVPGNFVSNNSSHFNSGWGNNYGIVNITESSYSSRVDTVKKGNSPCGSSAHLTGIGESIDQLGAILFGLASVKFFLKSSDSYNGYNFHQEVNTLVDNIVGHLKNNGGIPHSNCYGDYIYKGMKFFNKMLYYMYARSGCLIKQANGNPINLPMLYPVLGFGRSPAIIPETIYYPSHFTFYFKPKFGSFYIGYPGVCGDFNKWPLIPISRHVINSKNGGSRFLRKICNYPNAVGSTDVLYLSHVLSGALLPIALLFPSLVPTSMYRCNLCDWNASTHTYPATVGQPYFGIRVWVPIPLPFIKIWFGVATNVTENVLDGYAWGADHHFEPLASRLFYPPPLKSFLWGENGNKGNLYSHLIDVAPCQGPYFFGSPGSPNNEWMGYSRFTAMNRRLETTGGDPIENPECTDHYPTGEFPGLDYMALYNFYYLYKTGTNFAYYENIIDRYLYSTKHDLPTASGWGSYNKPAWIAAFRKIEAENHIEANSNVEYVAGEYIHMKPGFYVKAGATFHAYLDTLRGCDYSIVKPAGFYGPFWDSKNNSTYYSRNIVAPGNLAAKTSEEEEMSFKVMKSGKGYVNVYPNPATKRIKIDIYGPEAEKVMIRNVFGEIVYQTAGGFYEKIEVDISNFPAGVYFVEVISKKGVERTRFIKITK